MFGKNLKYFRQKRNLSMQELADLAGVSRMSISNYEKGTRRPDTEVLHRLASVLQIRVMDFLRETDDQLVFVHEEFRKTTKLNKTRQMVIREETEEYLSRLYEVMSILGGVLLPPIPQVHTLKLTEDMEENGRELREYFQMSQYGPVGSLVELLENYGFLVFGLNCDEDAFSGMKGFVQGRPYIVFNVNMHAERIRSTIAHELAHLLFSWPANLDESASEKQAAAISGAFLFPEEDAQRELGFKRKNINSRDLILVCEKYGISAYLAVKRANLCQIVSDYTAKQFYIAANQAGWKKNEPERIAREKPSLLESFVYRAVSEEEISAGKGAEYLKMPTYQFIGQLPALGQQNAASEQ